MAQIKNVAGLTTDDLTRALNQGAKFVVFQYTISVIFMTFRQSSDVYFIRAGESSIKYGLGFSLLTLLLGWWGIPWGPIYTCSSLYYNFNGGKDVTHETVAAINAGI